MRTIFPGLGPTTGPRHPPISRTSRPPTDRAAPMPAQRRPPATTRPPPTTRRPALPRHRTPRQTRQRPLAGVRNRRLVARDRLTSADRRIVRRAAPMADLFVEPD